MSMKVLIISEYICTHGHKNCIQLWGFINNLKSSHESHVKSTCYKVYSTISCINQELFSAQSCVAVKETQFHNQKKFKIQAYLILLHLTLLNVIDNCVFLQI